jgi:hypothetical protein
MKWLRQLRHECEPLGITVRHGSKHLRLELPTGRTLTAASTPSDQRAIHQVRASVKRALRGYAPAADPSDLKPEYRPVLEATPMPPLPEILEPNVIIEQPGIIEPLPILGKVVYHFSRSSNLPAILASGRLLPKGVIWATTSPDGDKVATAGARHDAIRRGWIKEIRFTCNDYDFRDGWRPAIKHSQFKVGTERRLAKQYGQSTKLWRVRAAPLSIDDTLIEMRDHGDKVWRPIINFSILSLPLPNVTAIQLEGLVYVSRPSGNTNMYMAPCGFDKLPRLIDQVMSEQRVNMTYEEALRRYGQQTDNQMGGWAGSVETPL